jgi:hypothetical protein
MTRSTAGLCFAPICTSSSPGFTPSARTTPSPPLRPSTDRPATSLQPSCTKPALLARCSRPSPAQIWPTRPDPIQILRFSLLRFRSTSTPAFVMATPPALGLPSRRPLSATCRPPWLWPSPPFKLPPPPLVSVLPAHTFQSALPSPQPTQPPPLAPPRAPPTPRTLPPLLAPSQALPQALLAPRPPQLSLVPPQAPALALPPGRPVHGRSTVLVDTAHLCDTLVWLSGAARLAVLRPVHGRSPVLVVAACLLHDPLVWLSGAPGRTLIHAASVTTVAILNTEVQGVGLAVPR